MASLPRSVRTTVVTALCCALFGVLGVLAAPGALAHDRLKSSSPAKNAKVSAVERITLKFSSRMRLPVVALRTANDAIIDTGKARATGDTVTSGIPAPLPAGRYVIAWRVVSSDGHPIEGEIPFTVTAPATPKAPEISQTPSATASPAPASTPEPSPSVSAQASSPTTARTSSPGPASATGEQDDGGSLPGWTWIALAALVLIGAGVRSLTSRRGRPGGAE